MAVTAAELNVVFASDTSDLKKGAGEAQGILKNVAATAGGFLAAQAFTGIVGGLKDLGAGMISANAQAETLRQSLDIAAGSMERGGKIFSDLQKMAANTPFEFPELMQAAVSLESLGVNAMDYMGVLGDTAAATGKSLDQVTQAFLDAQTGEFERLKEFGIRASVEGDKVLFSYMTAHGQVTKEVEKGNTAMYQSTLEAIWNEKYAGAMDKQAQTFSGMWSTLSDNFHLLMQEMGQPIFEFVKNGIGALNFFFTVFNKLREKGVNTFQAMWSGIRRALKEMLGQDNPLFQFIKDVKREIVKVVDAWREGGIVGAVQQVWDDARKAFGRAWHRLSGWLETTGIPNLITALDTLRTKLVANAPGWIQAARDKIEEKWGELVGWVQSDAVTNFVNGLGGLKDRLVTKIEETVPAPGELFAFASSLGANLRQAVEDLFGKAGGAAGGVDWTGVVAKIGDGIKAVLGFDLAVWSRVASAVGGFIAGAAFGEGVTWDQFVTRMADGISAAVTAARDWASGIKDTVLAKITGISLTAADLFSFGETAGKTIGTALANGIDAVDWTEVLKKIAWGLISYAKVVLTFWGGVATVIAGLIAGAIKGLATVDWSAFARELGAGLIDALNQLTNFGKDIWDTVVALLQAAVPTASELATAFAQIGKNIAAAISDAIWSALPDWARAGIGKLGGITGIGGGGEPASGTAPQGLMFRGGGEPSARGLMAGGGGRGGSYDQRTINLTVHTQATDPESVATAVMGRLYGALGRVGTGVA